MVRVSANGQGEQISIPGQVMPKTQKMIFDDFLLNTQYYKVRIKRLAPLGLNENWKGSFVSPSTTAG